MTQSRSSICSLVFCNRNGDEFF